MGCMWVQAMWAPMSGRSGAGGKTINCACMKNCKCSRSAASLLLLSRSLSLALSLARSLARSLSLSRSRSLSHRHLALARCLHHTQSTKTCVRYQTESTHVFLFVILGWCCWFPSLLPARASLSLSLLSHTLTHSISLSLSLSLSLLSLSLPVCDIPLF